MRPLFLFQPEEMQGALIKDGRTARTISQQMGM